MPVGGLGLRGDHGLDRPHLCGPAGGLGPGDAVALHGLGTGEPAGGAGHGVLPGGFQLPEPLVGPGGAGASDVPQSLSADLDDPACVVESGPVRRPRDPEQQRVARAHAARVPRERHRRVVHRLPRAPGDAVARDQRLVTGPRHPALRRRRPGEPGDFMPDGRRHGGQANGLAEAGRVDILFLRFGEFQRQGEFLLPAPVAVEPLGRLMACRFRQRAETETDLIMHDAARGARQTVTKQEIAEGGGPDGLRPGLCRQRQDLHAEPRHVLLEKRGYEVRGLAPRPRPRATACNCRI